MGGRPAALQAQGYTFSTLAGTPGVSGEGDNTAQFVSPYGLGADSAGNIYVADTFTGTIRKITSAGVVTRLAGSPDATENKDGTGSAAQIVGPYAVAVDGVGNVYVANSDDSTGGGGNYQIRKITSGGVVTTIRTLPERLARIAVDGAGIVYFIVYGGHGIYKFGSIGDPTLLAGGVGNGSAGYADGTGTNARFDRPSSLAVDQAGNVYVTDTNNHVIRKITSSGVVTTVAGLAGTQGNTDGTGTGARFNLPTGLAIDSTGSLYVFDGSNYTVRKITSGGVVTTLAGLALASGSTNGIGNAARFSGYLAGGQEPTNNNLAVDGSGNVYVAEPFTATIRKITSSGVVTTLAGTTGLAAFTDRPTLVSAQFSSPGGAAADSVGNVYVADAGNRAIRRISSDGAVTTLKADGFLGTDITDFSLPSGVAVDSAGGVYVADRETHTILKISYTGGGGAIGLVGSVSTLAGSFGTTGFTDGQGAAARFNAPGGVAVDDAGNVYVADTNNHTIRKITNGGAVTTLAGLAGNPGASNGTGNAARFSSPFGVAVDNTGTIYVAEIQNHTIRKITSGGVVTTLAGLAGSGGVADGTGAAARFNMPSGVAVDGAGNVYVADTGNHTIRMIFTDGTVMTRAGSAGSPDATDAIGNNARFNSPYGVAVDRNNNLLVADSANHTIRSFFGLKVSTLGGAAGSPGSADGFGSTARFNLPRSVAMDQAGNLYVADYQNHTIRKGVFRVQNLPVSTPVVTQTAAINGIVTLSIGFTAGSSYQWFRNGVAMPGASTSSLAVDVTSAGNSGIYTVFVTNSSGSVTAASVVLAVTAAGPSSALSNLSVRTTMASGQILIVGAVVNGGAKTILIRAGGPALNIFGLTGMVDPRLELYTSGLLPLATNDDWPAALTSTFSGLGAFPFNASSKDAALAQAINGAFTVQAKGTGPGTILVEAYDVAGGVSPRLVNLSARSLVGTGDDILIAGFNLAGTGTKQVLIRAIGPGLAAFGVPATLVDPKLQVFSASGTVVAANDNWAAALASTFAQVGAFALPPASGDAALLVTLNAGTSYTVQVSGADGGIGEALIEVYEVF